MGEIKTLVPRVSRRSFLRFGSATAFGFSLLPIMRPLNVWASRQVKLRGTADYCIFLFLRGGPSQIDTFDFKEGRWTPPDFDVRGVPGTSLKWPYGLFPRLVEKLDDLTIVRSVEAWDAAHPPAHYYLQVAHPFSPARRQEMPSIGAVIAYEMETRRQPSDYLPTFVSMNYGPGVGAGLVGAGCLGPQYNPLALDTRRGLDLEFVVPEKERPRFDRRWSLLRQLEEASGSSQVAAFRPIEEYQSHYAGAHSMMVNPQIGGILQPKEEERKSYGGSALGDACILARNLLAAQAGTRYIFVTQHGWDLHRKAYDKTQEVNQYTLAWDLDAAFSKLLTDLKELKTKEGARLLDKTLIVCMGEFGRTVGDLTVNKGRDHHRFAATSLFGGGGVRGGRIVGATDEAGARVVEPGWGKKRSIYTEDITATIYSALGIDWGKEITNTPSGRTFEYIESVSGTTFLDVGDIEPLFV